MRGRVHQPGRVQTNDGAKKDAPQQVLPSSRNKNDRTQCGNGHPMPMGDPHVELMSAKIRNIGQKISRFVVHRPASEDPAHVGPETPSRGECGSPSLSAFWWCTRCVATQNIGPPSRASVPHTVRQYSTHLGVLYA